MIESSLKGKVLRSCLDWIEAKISVAEKAVKDAQESANNEEKSSAGDKYETGRAMSQNERDMNARQLLECIKQKQVLLAIDNSKPVNFITTGSLIRTSNCIFFIGISIGKIIVADKSIFVVSLETPIGKVIHLKKIGEEFIFNGKKESILEIVN